MMAISEQYYVTKAAYERLENSAETKNEWHDGEIVAMAGGSPLHVLIQMNMTLGVGTRLKGRSCQVLGQDTRIASAKMYSYADLSVACPQAVFQKDSVAAVLLNPSIVFEILSPSTEKHDRGFKFQAYQSIESLTDYVLVSQERAFVEHFHRTSPNTWMLTILSGVGDVLTFPPYEISLPLSEIYEGVEFPPFQPPVELAEPI